MPGHERSDHEVPLTGRPIVHQPGKNWATPGAACRFVERKESPGSSGGKKARGGGTAEGGRRETRNLLVHVVHGNQANLAQLLIGEVGLFLSAGAFRVSQAGLTGNAVQFVFRNTKEHG